MANRFMSFNDPLGNLDTPDTLTLPEYSLVRKGILFRYWAVVDAYTEYFTKNRLRNVDHQPTRHDWIESINRLFMLLRPKLMPEIKDEKNEFKLTESEKQTLAKFDFYYNNELDDLTDKDLTDTQNALINTVEALGITKIEQKKTDLDAYMVDDL